MKRLPDSTIFIIAIAAPSLLILTVASAYALHHYHPMKRTQKTTAVAVTSSPYVYPSPNKKQAAINNPIDTGTMLVEVMGGNTTIQGTVVTTYGYTVRYTSESVAPVTVSGDNLDVGCIASNNHSYHDDGNIFNAGKSSTSLSALSARTRTLGTYEYVDVAISVPSSCQYIGTADGVWWWKVGLE